MVISDAKYGYRHLAEKSELCNRSVQQCMGGTHLTRKQCSQVLDQARTFSWPIPLSFQSLIPIHEIGSMKIQLSFAISVSHVLSNPVDQNQQATSQASPIQIITEEMQKLN